MNKLLLTTLLSLLISLGVNAQTDSAQFKQLRKQLKLSDSTIITSNNNQAFPVGKVIKIFTAIKHNKQYRKEFAEWVDDWNNKNSARNGMLQIIDNIEDADIVVTQFRHGTRKYVREDSVSITTSDKIQRDDDFIGSSVGNSKVRGKSGYRRLAFPLHSYLLLRGDNDSWVINFSHIDGLNNEDDDFSELRLQSIINNKMLDR